MMAPDPNMPPPEPVPPITPEPQPGDPKPAPPPVEDERGHIAPVKLPGDPTAPVRM